MGQIINDTLVLERVLGIGGSTEVFAAVQARTGDRYALKILRHDRPEWAPRLMREFEMLRTIAHPALISCFQRDYVTVELDGRRIPLPYLVLEPCEHSLRDWLVRRHEQHSTRIARAVPAHRLRIMFRPVIDLLERLRQHAVCHRDITPKNLMLGKDGSLRLIDFNLGVMAGQSRITSQGVAGGSGRFASPEQRSSLASTTPACDIYGLGLCLTEVATGHSLRPYTSNTGRVDRAALRATLFGEPSLGGPGGAGDRFALPWQLSNCLMKTLEEDPRRRPSPRELLDALDVCAEGQTSSLTIAREAPSAGRRSVPPPLEAALPALPPAPRRFWGLDPMRGLVWARRACWAAAGVIAAASFLR